MHLFFAGRNARRITLIANHLPPNKSSATPAAVAVEPVFIMAFATFPEDRGDREIAAEAVEQGALQGGEGGRGGSGFGSPVDHGHPEHAPTQDAERGRQENDEDNQRRDGSGV